MATISDEDDYVPSEVGSGVSEHESEAQDSYIEPSQHARERSQTGGSADEEDSQDGASSPSLSSSSTLRKKRKAHHHLPPYAGAPLKRQRRPFNPEYLNLLNQDIADAAHGLIADDTAVAANNDVDRLLLPLEPPTQVGAVRWSAVEKEAFFAALGRLGRDDLPGIAARVGGDKGPLEVRQLILLLEAAARRRAEARGRRQRALRPAEVPAAAELSHECAAALEEAADDLSLRQDAHEALTEEKRWGGGDRWLITPKVAAEEGGGSRGEDNKNDRMPFLDFFHARTWLRLSDRLFMNSAIPDYNWRYVSDEAPAIRATALADFHALTASVTRRLVASSLFMAGMRLKAQRQYFPAAPAALVKERDVQAAADSLNLGDKTKGRDFWARAARRLRVDVVDDEAEDPAAAAVSEGEEEEGKGEGDPEDDEESDGEHVMSYDDVEAALGYSSTRDNTTTAAGPPSIGNLEPEIQDEDDTEGIISDTSSLPEAEEEIGDEEADEQEEIARDVHEDAVKRDLLEARYYSADYGFTTRAREGLQLRIEAEHRMEAEAEEQDMRNSRHEEARMQALLRRTEIPSDAPLLKTTRARRNARQPEPEPAQMDWRDNVHYVSEWEMQ